MAVAMAYELDDLDGMGSILASPPESIQDKNNGKAEMARELQTNLLEWAHLMVRPTWPSYTS